jgi:aryl-alcohol dehydrogenase-like predicted oxidoreductase
MLLSREQKPEDPQGLAWAREAFELNIGFFSRMVRGRPWVRMKIAASLDGRTALPDGSSQWITGPAARDDGHAWRARACAILRDHGTPCVAHQPKYSLFERTPEAGLLDMVEKEGLGCAVFSPLAQGMLTDRYLRGIPADARAGKPHGYLRPEQLDAVRMEKVRRLAEVAADRGQPLASMAVAWVLRDRRITTAIIGASKVAQLEQCVAAASSAPFASEELKRIDAILAG